MTSALYPLAGAYVTTEMMAVKVIWTDGKKRKSSPWFFELADGFELRVKAGGSSVGRLIRSTAGADLLWHWRQMILRYCRYQVPVFMLFEQAVDMFLPRDGLVSKSSSWFSGTLPATASCGTSETAERMIPLGRLVKMTCVLRNLTIP